MRNLRAITVAIAMTGAALGMAAAPAAAEANGTTASYSVDEVGVFSATGCHGNTCIYVNGSGLRVNYATVTNRNGKYIGHGNISSTYDGRTHRSPNTLRKGRSWRFDYNRIMNHGNKVCGSSEGLDVACVTIKR